MRNLSVLQGGGLFDAEMAELRSRLSSAESAASESESSRAVAAAELAEMVGRVEQLRGAVAAREEAAHDQLQHVAEAAQWEQAELLEVRAHEVRAHEAQLVAAVAVAEAAERRAAGFEKEMEEHGAELAAAAVAIDGERQAVAGQQAVLERQAAAASAELAQATARVVATEQLAGELRAQVAALAAANSGLLAELSAAAAEQEVVAERAAARQAGLARVEEDHAVLRDRAGWLQTQLDSKEAAIAAWADTTGSRAAAIEQQVLGLRDETEALRAELATVVAGKAAAEGQLAAGRRLAEAAGDRVAEVDRTGPAELRQLMAELREGLGARELEAAAERAAERAVRAGQMRNVEQDLATAESNVGWLRAELIASQTQCRAAETVAAAAEERRTRGELAVKAEVALHGELAGSAASVLRLELDRLEAEQAELAAKHHARWRHTALTTFAALPVAKRSVACHPSLATLAAQTRDGPTPAQLQALQTENEALVKAAEERQQEMESGYATL